MKGDERAVLVLRGECTARVEQQRHRCPVPRECGHRGLLAVAARGLLAVAAIFRRVDELLFIHGVVAVRPPEIILRIHLDEFFGGILRLVLRRGEQLGPVVVQLVPAMLGGVELSVRAVGEPHPIADAGGESGRRREVLARLACIEAEEASARRQLGAGILARGFVRAVLHLAAVRRRAHVHDEHAVRADDEVARTMARKRDAVDHDFALACGNEGGVGALVAHQLGPFVDVEVAVGQADACVADGADARDDVGVAIMVGVAQGDERHGGRGRGALVL